MQAYLNIANISWVTSVANARLRRWAIHNNRSIPRKPPQKIRLRCKSWMKTEGIAIIATFYFEANPFDLPSWLHTQRSERSAMFWNRNIVTREVESHSLYKLSFRIQLNMNKPGTTTSVPGPTKLDLPVSSQTQSLASVGEETALALSPPAQFACESSRCPWRKRHFKASPLQNRSILIWEVKQRQCQDDAQAPMKIYEQY